MTHGKGNDKRRRVPQQSWNAQEAGRPLQRLGDALLEAKARRRAKKETR